MLIIAIDPSIRATGFAVLDNAILTSFGRTELRTAAQVETLVAQLASFKPDVVAIETTFVSVNPKTGIDLAELRGRLRQALESRLIDVALVAPGTWRKSTIKPPARSKRKALKAMSKAFALDHYGVMASDDESDAICIATHLSQLKPKRQSSGDRCLSQTAAAATATLSTLAT